MKTLILTGLSTFGCSKLKNIVTRNEKITVEDDLADYLLSAHINPDAPEGTAEVKPYFSEAEGEHTMQDLVDSLNLDLKKDGDKPTESTDAAVTAEAPAPEPTVTEAAPKATQRVPRGKK